PRHLRPSRGSRPHRVLGRRGTHPPLDATGRSRRRCRGRGAGGAARAPARARATCPRRALDFAARVEPIAFPGRVGAVAATLPLLALVFVAGCGGSGHAASTTTRSSTAARTTTAATTTTTTTEAAANPKEFSEFRIAMDEGTDYLDPGLSDTTEGWGVMWNVYLPLLGYRHVSGPR